MDYTITICGYAFLMNTYFKKWNSIFCLMLAFLPMTGFAESQFFFVGHQAPAGSITAAGQNQQVVYLRWGVVEGKLPADVVGLRLLRNGVKVTSTDWPANGVMSESEINNLYHGPEQQRRKLETINRLNELSASKGDSFSASSFTSYLRGLLDSNSTETYNPFWAYLGARTDFNIARARYRGWIDISPVLDSITGKVEYELLAVNITNSTVTLGKASVQFGVANKILGATNLRQVLNTETRCDMPENAKDHYTVALNWNSPGDEANKALITDRVAAQFLISGFDLYRTTTNLDLNIAEAPVRNISALAAQANADSRGDPKLSGLEKVNVSLVVDSGTTNEEPKWLEARDLLQRAGLKPGDRRAYYLVPRDFTGNYGPTIATIVTVPQMTRPPAPWNIRAFADQSSSILSRTRPDALSLTWDAVNLDNYQRMFQDTREYCNLAEAQQTGILEFVGKGKNCATDVRSSVRLDVAGYRIYQFVDFDVAGRFKDSDGDGVSDSDEIPDLNNDGKIDANERTHGTQCDASKQPSDLHSNYLLSPTSQELLFGVGQPGEPEIVRLRDTSPAIVKDTVIWYRIASVAGSDDKNGRLSFLSAPQRALFPNRTPPPEPIIEVTKPGNSVPIGCELKTVAGGPWSFTDERVIDEKAKEFTVSCASNSFFDDGVATSSSSQCGTRTAACASASNATLSFPATAATGNIACNVSLPDDVFFCNAGSVTLFPKYAPELAQAGDLIIDGGVTINGRPPNSRTCIALFETIDGTSTRVANSCDAGGFSYRPGNGQFCGYAIATDENNNISATVYIPCTLAPSNPKPPGPPQIQSFVVGIKQAQFTFRLPAEQVAITLARLDHEPGDGSSDRQFKSIPVITVEAGESVSYSWPVDELTASKDRFCLSLLAIAPSAGTAAPLRSPWSKERCYSRNDSGEDLPEYLPWPEVKSPSEGEPLSGFLTEYRGLSVLLGMGLKNENDLLDLCERILPDQIPGTPPPEPSTPEGEYTDFDALECTDNGMVAVKAALASELNFMLYRQHRISNGTESNWVQVSPLIEYAHFDDIPTRTRGEKDALSFIEWRLNDPFVKILYSDTAPDTLQFIFVDHYPFATHADYPPTQPYEFRYQAVYFDKDQRPVRWRQSAWFSGGNQ
jgi:hypothetical protein